MTATAARPDGRPSRRRRSGGPLVHAVAAALGGHEPPCASAPSAWYSTEPEAVARAVAACRTCPALAPCAVLGDAQAGGWGVWGGRDRTPKADRRHQRTTDPLTEETA